MARTSGMHTRQALTRPVDVPPIPIRADRVVGPSFLRDVVGKHRYRYNGIENTAVPGR